MKKISRYLIIVVVVGGILISFWSYQKYFKKTVPELLSFSVEKGSIQEVVKVRGEVISQKDFNLEFPFSGIVEKVFVKEGQQVYSGAPLIKLETTDFKLKIKKTQAQQAQAEANFSTQKAKLAELKQGTRPEEIQVQKIRVANSKTALEDAKQNLIDKLQDAYTKSDDAVRNKVDQFFNNPRSSNPEIKFFAFNESAVKWQRVLTENTLKSWETSLSQLTILSNLNSYITKAKKNLNQVKSFLDKVAFAVNGAIPNSNLSQTTLDGWKLDVVTARTNVNIAIANITASEGTLKTAKSNLALAEQELILKKAGAIEEQITAQEAQVKQAEANIQNYQAQIAIIQENIKKSILYAPASAKIVKLWFKKQEFFRPGRIAVTLETSGYKIQADISELEIGKVVNGNKVLIQLDAFPNLEFKGKIISIEPKEITKEGDTYYRANISIEQNGTKIRPGMSTDLTILISFKENVLKIPELAISQKGDKKFVTVLEGNQQKKVEIKTGISDGKTVEVIKGLREKQTIVVSAD